MVLRFIKRVSPIVNNFGVRTYKLLRCCATSLEVAGSIPDGVIGIFIDNPSGHTMALGSTQPPTEMSTRNIS
jgi:hypothetical protein